MIKVAICDDLPEMTTEVEQVLSSYDGSLFEPHIFFSPSRLLNKMTENSYDLFILDIEFPEYSGIELAKKIRKKNYNVPIVFLTNFKEYMEDVFEVQTFDYILKPINREKFFPVLDRVIKYLDVEDEQFSFSFKRITYTLKINDIVFFEKRKRQVIIHTATKTYLTILSMSDLLAKLNGEFVQVHTSYVVNVKYLKEISNKFLILTNQPNSVQIPISRKFRAQARDKILMKLRSKI